MTKRLHNFHPFGFEACRRDGHSAFKCCSSQCGGGGGGGAELDHGELHSEAGIVRSFVIKFVRKPGILGEFKTGVSEAGARFL